MFPASPKSYVDILELPGGFLSLDRERRFRKKSSKADLETADFLDEARVLNPLPPKRRPNTLGNLKSTKMQEVGWVVIKAVRQEMSRLPKDLQRMEYSCIFLKQQLLLLQDLEATVKTAGGESTGRSIKKSTTANGG